MAQEAEPGISTTPTSDGKQSDVNVQTPSLVQWFSVRGLWPRGGPRGGHISSILHSRYLF